MSNNASGGISSSDFILFQTMLARDLELGFSRVMPNNPIGGHLESVFKSGMSNKYCWGHLK